MPSRAIQLKRVTPVDDGILNEAEVCRQKALSYLGKPEATFLLRIAREFDRLGEKAERSVHRAADHQNCR